MKLAPQVAAVPLLLLLLTWLAWRATNSEAELFDRSLAALDHFAMVENALHRDVLTTRTGMLRNYDPLVRDVNALQDSLDRLTRAAAFEKELAAPVDRLAVLVRPHEKMVEQFKSDNALLRNSLAYFGVFSVALGAMDQGRPLDPGVSALAAAMLHFTLDTSTETAREVEARLDALAKQAPPSDKADSIQALVAHGRMIFRLLPTTDGNVKALLAVPTKREEAALRTVILTHQKASRDAARTFRLLLYATSLLLLGVLVQLGLRLRARALALMRRAALEHMIADISTHFINAQPEEMAAQIEQALGRLAGHMTASRGYVALAGAPQQAFIWRAKGVSCSPDWPDQGLALARQLKQREQEIIQIPNVENMEPGEDKDRLAAAGVRGWACVLRMRGDDVAAILAFDAPTPYIISPHDDFGLMRMALDAIANAVGRNHLEQERARLQQRLARARRLETVGALTSGIAHNFNNIIGAILGYAEMAEAKVKADARLIRDLHEIRRAAELARDLIDQILVFGRPRDARRVPVRLGDLIGEAASLLRASMPPGIELIVHEAPAGAVVSADRAQLQQVILNLCSNAAQAMDGNGRIEVAPDVQDVTRPRTLSHGSLAPGRYVRIAVSDAGRGIDEAVLRHIFEPFFTTRAAGNGLGLATARDIVREHDGVMNVLTKPGAGTSVEAWLPCMVEGVLETNEPGLPVGQGQTLLVLDEDRETLLKSEEILAALGYEPVGFSRLSEAMTAYSVGPQRFDAIVVNCPRGAGPILKLAAALHDMAPNLPIVLATASAEEIGVDALLRAGISEVVRLPFISSEIAAALRHCLAAPQAAPARAPAS
ncbi:integral membrane sensor hybrid histidine kinase [Methylocella silvestris BL2]|uniref:histidine kinase n=1 Tax=Methylocella silvestris (strain DSM 15510 / CIP 108128 / LMG 27833 / NCIMB 13906 / BL2) TaxID=395965 RepID=B8EMV6_METSB|nr:two-component system VirA-like sensor kinase [Methylocella silvestris]ACK52785.1 integral membrane sensor hybrid histidine kinase [Methylocella silvestris BL2]